MVAERKGGGRERKSQGPKPKEKRAKRGGNEDYPGSAWFSLVNSLSQSSLLPSTCLVLVWVVAPSSLQQTARLPRR